MASAPFINGEVTYGTVTDEWDRRCLKVLLKRFLSEESSLHKCPDESTLSGFKSYVEQLPISDAPEVFGLHENAKISHQSELSRFFLATLSNREDAESLSGGNFVLVQEKIAAMRQQLVRGMNIDSLYWPSLIGWRRSRLR